MNEHIVSIINILESSIISHKKGDYKSISLHADSIILEANHESLKQEDNNTYNNIIIAVNFLDAWGDCANHDFLYYPLKMNEWPELAAEIISHLKNCTPILNLKINEFISPKPHFYSDIKTFLKKIIRST